MLSKLLGLVGVKIPSMAQIWVFLGAIILIVAMVTYCLHILNAAQEGRIDELKRANTAENNLAALKHGYDTETAKRAQEHVLKLALSEQKAIESEQNYQAEIARLKIDRTKLKGELENEKTYLAGVLNDAYQLRVQASSNSTGRSEVPSDTELPTDPERNCHSTVARLIQAGQSCALDYKSLYESWQNNCEIYGCKK